MNNFRRQKPTRSSRSFDGMLAHRPKHTRTGLSQKNESPVKHRPGVISGGRLDNFRAPNGFHASVQPTLGNSAIPIGRSPRRDVNGQIDLTLPPAPAKPKKRKDWKKLMVRSGAGIFISILLVGGVLFGKGYLKLQSIFKGGAQGAAALQNNVDPNKLRGEGDGRVNVLLLGRGGDSQASGPDLTDTIIIASIDPIQKKAALLSLPRDLYVKNTSNYKLNAVFAEAKYAAQARKASTADAEKAGFNAIEKQIQDYIGIPIHYHVMIDYAGFVQAINTVGGVDINVDQNGTVYERLWDDVSRKNYVLDVKVGQQHFDGQRALFYSRSRQTSPRGDFDRTERQRKVMLALKDKVLSTGTFANPIKLSGLIDAFGNHVQTNMSKEEVLRLYDIGKNINGTNLTSVGLADPPNSYVTTANLNGSSIVRPVAGLTDYSEIQNYVRNALKDGYIANENASIAIYNGTTIAGLATKKATELKSYGYNVNTIADAPNKNYQKTVLVNLRGKQKKYTLHYLEQRLGVTAVDSLPDSSISNPGNADFVIILGQP